MRCAWDTLRNRAISSWSDQRRTTSSAIHRFLHVYLRQRVAPEIAGAWLWLTMWLAREKGDGTLFFRVWSLTDSKIQVLFTRRFEKQFGVSLKELMEKMRKVQNGEEDAA